MGVRKSTVSAWCHILCRVVFGLVLGGVGGDGDGADDYI
jgi:hypothetical protein